MITITAESALSFNHMTTIGTNIIDIFAPNKYLDKIVNGTFRYIYLGEVDSTNYVRPWRDFLLPTVERAIVDYIRFEKIQDEGTLIWAIQDYIEIYKKDMTDIYEVATFYNVPLETIDYWFKEAREEQYYSMG